MAFSSQQDQKTRMSVLVCGVNMLNHYFRPPKSTLTDDNTDDCHSDSEDEASTSAATQYAFPEIDTQIQAAIDAYGGGVFPKLNFSSPKARFPLFCSV